jgi:hypothetical protein
LGQDSKVKQLTGRLRGKACQSAWIQRRFWTLLLQQTPCQRILLIHPVTNGS